MSNIMRRAFVEEAVEKNIGPANPESWVSPQLHDRRTVRAYGVRALHINAGNVAVITLLFRHVYDPRYFWRSPFLMAGISLRR